MTKPPATLVPAVHDDKQNLTLLRVLGMRPRLERLGQFAPRLPLEHFDKRPANSPIASYFSSSA